MRVLGRFDASEFLLSGVPLSGRLSQLRRPSGPLWRGDSSTGIHARIHTAVTRAQALEVSECLSKCSLHSDRVDSARESSPLLAGVRPQPNLRPPSHWRGRPDADSRLTQNSRGLSFSLEARSGSQSWIRPPQNPPIPRCELSEASGDRRKRPLPARRAGPPFLRPQDLIEENKDLRRKQQDP